MFSMTTMPSPSSLFSAFATITASIMFFQSMLNQILPKPVRDYLIDLLYGLFKSHSPTLTYVFDEGDEFSGFNQIFEAADFYLDTLRGPKTRRLNVHKSPKEKGLNILLEDGEQVTDFYEGIELCWTYISSNPEDKSSGDSYGYNNKNKPSYEKRFYELSFHSDHEHKVRNSYIPLVLERAKAIMDQKKVLKIHTLDSSFNSFINWQSVNLEHPASFETLAMDQTKKNSIIEDLNRFVKRKEFYKKVGRAWKRGYLLYGPPGTGKSSLVAAMANHLKFEIYDLQLSNVHRDSDLRRLLLGTANRSIIVIEDIDCSIKLPDRHHEQRETESCHDQDDKNTADKYLTLSGLLNFIDGLWSSCGDERIIIFTANHKEKLDPALLRPGRMDMHIHMGYCTYEAFKQLASNYLDISCDHHLYGEIKGLLEETEVSPAEIAEEMMKYEKADSALEGIVDLLKRKKMESGECEAKTDDEKK